MAQLTHNFALSLPPLLVGTTNENGGKRLEEWEGSSPCHSESESSRSSNSAPESRASSHDEENSQVHEPLSVSTDSPTISLDAKFHSFKQFEDVFEAWKKQQFHPFRVASSETLKEPDGTVNPIFKYRYVVYHCAHYGEPRMRGIGKRPNQTYLPCGCRAMLRVNYSFQERVLKITTLEATHTGHSQSQDVYSKAMKGRGSLSPAGNPKRAKRDPDSSFSSPLSIRNSPVNTTAASSIQNSPAAVSPASVAIQNALLLQHQQHQAMINAILNQKENINQTNQSQQIQYALNRAQLMINQLSFPFINPLQPAHGVVPPVGEVAPQPALQMKTHAEQANELIDVVNDFPLPSNLPAPKPIKREGSPPPILERADLETLKPVVKQEIIEALPEELSEGQKTMLNVLKQLLDRVKSLSSEQVSVLLPQLETCLTLSQQ